MKLFYVGPNLDESLMSKEVIEARARAAVEPIADLVLTYLRADGFAALVGLSALNAPDAGSFPARLPRPPYPPLVGDQERFGRYVVSRFGSENEVRSALIGMGDCYGTSPPRFFCVRSIISCRCVTYGYDGQAFLCLHATDPSPVTPDPDLVLVEERPDLLIKTDFVDGVEAVEDW